jgi:hypothetical protein
VKEPAGHAGHSDKPEDALAEPGSQPSQSLCLQTDTHLYTPTPTTFRTSTLQVPNTRVREAAGAMVANTHRTKLVLPNARLVTTLVAGVADGSARLRRVVASGTVEALIRTVHWRVCARGTRVALKRTYKTTPIPSVHTCLTCAYVRVWTRLCLPVCMFVCVCVCVCVCVGCAETWSTSCTARFDRCQVRGV